MGLIKKIIIIILVFSPFYPLIVIAFFPEIWKGIFPSESLSFIFNQIMELYQNDPIPTIAFFGAIFGVITYYYGTIISSETKYLKTAESVESRLLGISFFTIIPSLLLLMYFLKSLPNLFTLRNFVIIYFFLYIIIQQVKIKKEFSERLGTHYEYNNLLYKINNPMDPVTAIKRFYKGEEKAELHLGGPLLIFEELLVFICAYVLLKTDIATIPIFLLLWLIFVSTTVIAVYYSIEYARYFLADIELENKSYNNAIYVREEKDNFIRIIPNPEDFKAEDNHHSKYNGIIINRDKILSINYHDLSQKNDSKNNKD